MMSCDKKKPIVYLRGGPCTFLRRSSARRTVTGSSRDTGASQTVSALPGLTPESVGLATPALSIKAIATDREAEKSAC